MLSNKIVLILYLKSLLSVLNNKGRNVSKFSELNNVDVVYDFLLFLIDTDLFNEILLHECTHIMDFFEQKGNVKKYMPTDYKNDFEFKAFLFQYLNKKLFAYHSFKDFEDFYCQFIDSLDDRIAKDVLLYKGEEFLKKILKKLYIEDFKTDLVLGKQNLEENKHLVIDCSTEDSIKWWNSFLNKINK